jgi:hypothetical protein
VKAANLQAKGFRGLLGTLMQQAKAVEQISLGPPLFEPVNKDAVDRKLLIIRIQTIFSPDTSLSWNRCHLAPATVLSIALHDCPAIH